MSEGGKVVFISDDARLFEPSWARVRQKCQEVLRLLAVRSDGETASHLHLTESVREPDR